VDEINTPDEADDTGVWVCSECGEPVTNTPPRCWTGALGPRPSWSHLDGEPLCPSIGPDGYQPAKPERIQP
jgi:hypothetical protein